MKRKYKGVVWTDHALVRMQERGIAQSDAWYAFRRPDQSRYVKTNDSWIYIKTLEDKTIEVVAKKENSEWIIISVWSKDVNGNQPRRTKKRSLLTRIIKFFG